MPDELTRRTARRPTNVRPNKSHTHCASQWKRPFLLQIHGHQLASELLLVLRPIKARNVLWTHSKNFIVIFSGRGGASPLVACNTSNVNRSEVIQVVQGQSLAVPYPRYCWFTAGRAMKAEVSPSDPSASTNTEGLWVEKCSLDYPSEEK